MSNQSVKAPRSFLPHVELLEDRITPDAHIWSGAGGDALWSNDANWLLGGAPSPVEAPPVTLAFPLGGAPATTNDVLGLVIDQLNFAGTGYTLNGSPGGNLLTFSDTGLISDALGGNVIEATNNMAILNSAMPILSATGELQIDAPISGTGGVLNAGLGTLILTAANTYAGATQVNLGILNIRNNTALGVADGTAGTGTAVTLGAALELQGGINVGNEDLTISGLGVLDIDTGLFGGALNSVSGINSWAGPVHLANSAPVAIGVQADQLTITGVIDGGLLEVLTKLGAGTLILEADNVYQAVTLVNAGTLFVNGSQPQSEITVGGPLGGATLGGTGTTGGIVLLPGSNVAPGENAPGILNADGDVSFIAASSFDVDIAGQTVGTEYDQLNVNGLVALVGATLNLNSTIAPTPPGVRFTIINNDGDDPVIGVFLGLLEGNVISSGGQDYQITYLGGDGNDVELITLGEGNTPPVAVADFYSTQVDMNLNITAPGVLANDFDQDGDPLTARIVQESANGTVNFNADGSFLYDPDPGFRGVDFFTYEADDGTNISTSVGKVNILVSDRMGPPIALPDVYSTGAGEQLIIAAPGVLDNDFDGDGDPLTAQLVGPTANGTLNFNADGSFDYTPDQGFTGADFFSYQANDGVDGTSNTTTVTILVHPLIGTPVAIPDIYSTDEDVPLTTTTFIEGVLGNDIDPENDTLTATLVAGPSNGSVTLNPDGTFTYTPGRDFDGIDTFIYRANDGESDSNVATATIFMNPINDAPVAVGDIYSVVTDGGPLIVGGPGVLLNDFDVEGDPLTASLVSSTANGTLVFSGDGSFVYTPNEGFIGTDIFTYNANDGELDSLQPGQVSIVVTPLGGAPVVLPDAYSTFRNTALNIGAPGVLLNDLDGEGDPLTAALVGGPSSGTLVFNANGSFTYTPDFNFTGLDTFTYRANDGSADSLNTTTVSILVFPLDQMPVALPDVYAVPISTTINVFAPGVLGNDLDPENDPLSVASFTPPANGTLILNPNGSFSYTPAPGFRGVDEGAIYRATDGVLDSNIAPITFLVGLSSGPFDDFDDEGDVIGTGNVQPGSATAEAILVNKDDVFGEGAIMVVDPLNQTILSLVRNSGQFTGCLDATDEILFSDFDGDGTTEVVFVNRPGPGETRTGIFVRIVDPTTGAIEKTISYDEIIPFFETNLITYGQAFENLVNPEDIVLSGQFTQQNHGELLFLNRTNQNHGTIALRSLNLRTMEVTFTSFHDGNIFGGWLDGTDEYIVYDSNNDGFDDLTIINRVPNPEAFRNTNTGFVGMISIRQLPGAPGGPFRGFYRFFNWNFALPGENSVFPGYDEITDKATGGTVFNNGRPVSGILLANTSERMQAAYAFLEPRPIVQGVPDSFRLESTQFHGPSNNRFFDFDDSILMDDFRGIGSDDVLSYHRIDSPEICVFDTFTGATLGCINNSNAIFASGVSGFRAERDLAPGPASTKSRAANIDSTLLAALIDLEESNSDDSEIDWLDIMDPTVTSSLVNE